MDLDLPGRETQEAHCLLDVFIDTYSNNLDAFIR